MESYNEALMPIFVFMVALALALVKEKPLATGVQQKITAEALAEGQLLPIDPAEPDHDNPASAETTHGQSAVDGLLRPR